MSIDITNFGDYSVKGVKSFQGREGLGFNCNLYRGKKKVAFCYDDASGGEVRIDWLEGRNSQESKLLERHVDSLPKVNSQFDGVGLLTIDDGWFVSDLVAKWEAESDIRKLRKQCSTKTFFRTPTQEKGQYSYYKAPISDALRTKIQRENGDDVEIFNDVFAAGNIPSVFA